MQEEPRQKCSHAIGWRRVPTHIWSWPPDTPATLAQGDRNHFSHHPFCLSIGFRFQVGERSRSRGSRHLRRVTGLCCEYVRYCICMRTQKFSNIGQPLSSSSTRFKGRDGRCGGQVTLKVSQRIAQQMSQGAAAVLLMLLLITPYCCSDCFSWCCRHRRRLFSVLWWNHDLGGSQKHR
jgi:hypothetical protein